MDIEAIVKKFSGGFLGIDGRSAQNILRTALTEADAAMAMEHNLKMLQVEAAHTIELRAYEVAVEKLAERIKQLEAERVPGGFLSDVITAAGLVRHGKRDKGLSERLSIAAMSMLAAAPLRCHLCDYQHGHKIGCLNNPVDIALRAAAPAKEGE